MSTRPRPADAESTSAHAPEMVPSLLVTTTLRTARAKVIQRRVKTSSFSVACGLTKRRQKSLTRYDVPQLSCVAIVDMNAARKAAKSSPTRPGGSVSVIAITKPSPLSAAGRLGKSTRLPRATMIHGHGRRQMWATANQSAANIEWRSSLALIMRCAA